MKKIILFLFFAVLIAFGQTIKQSPCNDSFYLELKNRHVDSMSQREYDYFILKERYCHEQLTAEAEIANKPKMAWIAVRVEGTQNERLTDAPDLNRVRRYWEDRLAIYLDEMKQKSLEFECSPGVHTVSLFSEGAIEEEHGDLRAHMKQSRLVLKVESNKIYTILFSFRCQPYQRSCGEDEWYFDITYKQKSLPRID